MIWNYLLIWGERMLKDWFGKSKYVTVQKGNEEKEGATNTTDLNANEAIELVKETFNIDLLKGWQEQDSRKTVLQAIDEQIKFLYGNEDNEEEVV